MCECVVESAIFALKFENSEISGKELKRDFTVKVREKPVILESPKKTLKKWFFNREFIK